MTVELTILSAMKAATWERAKGELRALVGIKGSVSTPPPEEPPYMALERAVEAFIKMVENEALQE